SRVFPACHAVVIEDLEHYRPDQTQTRRENVRLAHWAARNVRKLIMEGCELNGLHFVEVSPRFTSQHDSRSGGPGRRCQDMPIKRFLGGRDGTIPKVVLSCAGRILDERKRDEKESETLMLERACHAADQKKGTASERYVLQLFRKLMADKKSGKPLP